MDLREQLNKVKQTSSKRAGQVKVQALYSGFVFGTGEIMSKRNYYLKKTCGIYCFTHIESGRQYVGQSIDCAERFKQHTTPKKGASGIKGAIMKYGVDAFSFQILEECSKEELNEREIYWIAQLGTLSPGGYNLNSGGSSKTQMSDETKLKMSTTRKGKPSPTKGITLSENAKRRMSESRKGKPLSDEHRANISQAKKNISEETRAKLSQASKGNQHAKGRTLSEETRAKISQASKGKQHAKGRTFSEETRAKISESMIGRVPSNKGKTTSEETRAKISAARKEYWRKRKEVAEACKDSD